VKEHQSQPRTVLNGFLFSALGHYFFGLDADRAPQLKAIVGLLPGGDNANCSYFGINGRRRNRSNLKHVTSKIRPTNFRNVQRPTNV
jgi:hypothetical protein